MRLLRHLKRLITHKYWVLYYCIMCGETLRGLTHDMSKLLPVELFESIKYATGETSPLRISKKANGYSKAYLHHIGNNDHHYEHWIDDFDNGGHAIRMPYHCVVELICDYIGAAKTYQGSNFTFESEYDWWIEKSNKNILMHPDTKKFITFTLKECKRYELHYKMHSQKHKYPNFNKYIHRMILNRNKLINIYAEIINCK